ncbi:hypothetical protein [Ferrimonas pelagia]|uniref:Uncharacterized protein n=1 Tax=Ferrimonas pelagia TaxID=1177826 RepID=A0ABP9ETB8_9GAMM
MHHIIYLVLPLLLLSGCGETKDLAHNPVTESSLCDFTVGPCANAGISLAPSLTHTPSEQPFQLKMTMPDGYQITAARLEGRDMYMGVIPVRFDEHGHATVLYGSCSSGYMVWRLWLTFEDSQGDEIVRFFDWLADSQV